MPEGNDLTSYDPEVTRKKLVEAARQNRWLTILEPPYDHSLTDPRQALAFENISNILGRLGVAVHAMYEYAAKGQVPLLYKDRKNKIFEYLVPDKKTPALNHIVLLLGHSRRWWERQNPNCKYAVFTCIPEIDLPEIRKNPFYLALPHYTSQKSFQEAADNGVILNQRPNARHTATIHFTKNGVIDRFGLRTKYPSDIHEQPTLSIDYIYDFDHSRAEARLSQTRYNTSSVTSHTLYTLSYDGHIRNDKAKLVDFNFEEALLEHFHQLAIQSYIDNTPIQI